MLSNKVSKALLALLFGGTLLFPAATSYAAAPAPVLHNDNPNGNAGDWYTGAVPSQPSSDKPVILFVQGLHASYDRWLGSDSYYDAAYNAGYRTAFVQLPDADGSAGTMWTNGQVLADVIRKVADYYHVPQINIIAHSKGGIDTQTALVYDGAAPYVNVVHQLSTPNKGSELADLAYSAWVSWLADILGQQDDAVYSLQTSYMANYRAQTDNKAENSLTTTYMSGGMGDDGIFTSGWFAHAILPGEDDGAVSVDSAMGLPYGIPSFTKNISHSAMAAASQTWSLVRPKLALGKLSVNELGMAPAAEKVEEDSSLIMRGGTIDGSDSVSFPLESGIGSVAMEVMTAQSGTELTLTSPTGKIYQPEAAPADADPDGIFNKAVTRVFQIPGPEAGKWTLQLNGSQDAYFALARIDSNNKTTVRAPKKVFRKGESSELNVSFDKPIKGKVKHPQLSKSAKGPAGSAGFSSYSARALPETAVNGNLELPFTAPSEPGVYNLSLDVEGVNDQGEKVVRSINYNFAVTDDQGKLE